MLPAFLSSLQHQTSRWARPTLPYPGQPGVSTQTYNWPGIFCSCYTTIFCSCYTYLLYYGLHLWVATLGCYTGFLQCYILQMLHSSIWVATLGWSTPSGLQHTIGLIHPTHSGRSGCKDSFLLTGPFYSAILCSILLCSSRVRFTFYSSQLGPSKLLAGFYGWLSQ